MLPQKIAFLDIETTGMNLRSDRIIEIGILRIENNILTKTFHSLINPGKHIPSEIELLTGITPADIESSPTFRQIKDEILETIDGCFMAAHNVRFDYSFLKNEFRNLEIDFSPKHFCTVKLSRNLFPKYKHHNLDSLIKRYSFSCNSRHRALDDAKILWDFYQLILKKFKPEQVEKAISKITKRPSIPLKIPQDELDNLPDSPGVYIFYGQNNLPLYIGKSINIRQRVLNHFSSDHLLSSDLKISQQVERIEIIKTSGELGALLKESELIKKHQPLYNRKLRQTQKLVVLKSVVKSNYFNIDFDLLENIAKGEIENILGIFKSQKQAQTFLINLAKEFSLCDKLLNLEKSSNACFGYRLGRCKGACISKEHPAKYNLRFQEAFSNHKIRSWPFSGPIMINEPSIDGIAGEAFVVDNWTVIGKVSYNQFVKEDYFNNEVSFDLDSYKILSNYLKFAKNIQLLKPGIISSIFRDPTQSF